MNAPHLPHLPHLFHHSRPADAPFESEGDVVEFQNVSLSFGENVVLRDVSFRILPGETRIVLGPAGTGKSVLLKLIDGLIRPDSGSIHVFGHPVFADGKAAPEHEMYTLRAHIGMVFQESALFDSLTVRDNVGYRLDEEKTDIEMVDARVLEALNFVELGNTMEKFPSELSGGMRRRVSIARAIVTNPSLLLYDSPTGGLDPITSSTIIQLVVKQRDLRNTTSLVVTNRMQDAFAIATHRFNAESNEMRPIPNNGMLTGIDPKTKYLVLHDGNIAYDGDTRGLIESSDPWLKEFLS